MTGGEQDLCHCHSGLQITSDISTMNARPEQQNEKGSPTNDHMLRQSLETVILLRIKYLFVFITRMDYTSLAMEVAYDNTCGTANHNSIKVSDAL